MSPLREIPDQVGDDNTIESGMTILLPHFVIALAQMIAQPNGRKIKRKSEQEQNQGGGKLNTLGGLNISGLS